MDCPLCGCTKPPYKYGIEGEIHHGLIGCECECHKYYLCQKCGSEEFTPSSAVHGKDVIFNEKKIGEYPDQLWFHCLKCETPIYVEGEDIDELKCFPIEEKLFTFKLQGNIKQKIDNSGSYIQ